MLTDLLQPTHLIIVLVVAFLVLGPKRLPGAGRALGQGLREFKESVTARHDQDHDPDRPAVSIEAEAPGSD